MALPNSAGGERRYTRNRYNIADGGRNYNNKQKGGIILGIMKYITVFAVFALVLASGCVTPSDKEGVESGSAPAVKIGTLLPLTGDLAAYGGPMEDGARLAVKEVNENGGVLGGDITRGRCSRCDEPTGNR